MAIESWARARDPVVAAAYGTLGIGTRVQTEVWMTFLQRLTVVACHEITPEVQIVTDVLSADPGGTVIGDGCLNMEQAMTGSWRA